MLLSHHEEIMRLSLMCTYFSNIVFHKSLMLDSYPLRRLYFHHTTITVADTHHTPYKNKHIIQEGRMEKYFFLVSRIDIVTCESFLTHLFSVHSLFIQQANNQRLHVILFILFFIHMLTVCVNFQIS
jgi:hypothetical protein